MSSVKTKRKMFFVLSRTWDKEKNSEAPLRNQNSDFRIPRSDTQPLSHRDSTMSEVYYEVHITRIVHTSRISNVDSVMFLNRIREMVSFQLGNEIEKYVFRLVASFFDQVTY